MPTIKRLASTDGREAAESLQAPEVSNAKQKPCAVNELPTGFMGKMLVYESGAIKLKIGETLYDVSTIYNTIQTKPFRLCNYLKLYSVCSHKRMFFV